MPDYLTLSREWVRMLFDHLTTDAARVNVLRALADFAFDGIEPNGLSADEKNLFRVFRSIILERERSRRRYVKKRENLTFLPCESHGESHALTSKHEKSVRISRSENLTSNQYMNTVITPFSVSKDTHSPTGEKGTARRVFRPPTLEEVAAYCRERGNNVDPEAFMAHYDAVGWRVGRNPMKDFKAAVRYWEQSGFNAKPEKPKRDYTGL